MKDHGSFLLLFLLAFALNTIQAQDSSAILKKITVRASKHQNRFTSTLPTQGLDKDVLKHINAPSVGDAARFFSGVQVKDYGGAGGLKTISTRSLGVTQTGILYDGITVADAQSGQVDLSRYSSTFLQSIDLYQANIPGSLLPARSFSSASILSFNTLPHQPGNWQAGFRTGSFGYNQLFAGSGIVLPRNLLISGNIDLVSSAGDYPFLIDNGNISEKTRRKNGKIKSLQAEINASKLFADSSYLQVKGWIYDSRRGLPGAIIFFNDRAVQQLSNRDYFFQGKYRRALGSASSMIISGKYSNNYTRYTDPDFLNNSGGLDDRYRQNEWYLSGAVNRRVGRFFLLDLSSDMARAGLSSSKARLANPSRLSNWNNFQINYDDSLWHWNASMLWSRFSDRVAVGNQAETKSRFTPTVALSRRWSATSPFILRAFYKHIFRMPTFNDLYYNFIGNTGLKPEYSRQLNAGLAFSRRYNSQLKSLGFSADVYYNAVRDKIVAVPAQNLFSWTMLNLGKVEIRGIDFSGEAKGVIDQKLEWFVRMAYTFQHAQDFTDKSSVSYGQRIPYSPDHSGSGMFSLQYMNWSSGYSSTFSSLRYSLGENNPYNQLKGWGVQDIFLSRKISFSSLDVVIKGEINNIADNHYDVIRYFPMPGRSYKLSIQIGKF